MSNNKQKEESDIYVKDDDCKMIEDNKVEVKEEEEDNNNEMENVDRSHCEYIDQLICEEDNDQSVCDNAESVYEDQIIEKSEKVKKVMKKMTKKFSQEIKKMFKKMITKILKKMI